MRKQFLLAAALAAWSIAPAAARVAPITPDQKLMLDRQNALENAMRGRFSDGAFNRLRDMHGSIIVGQTGRRTASAPRVLFKDEHGWQELRPSGPARLPRRLAHELDRLLVDGRLWNERPYVKDARCAAPTVFVLRYSGNEKFGRQCAPAGLSGRAAEVAKTLRIPPGRGRTTAPSDGGSIGPAEDMSAQVSARVREMIYAWERRNLAGAVDPYADNAIIQFEDGRVLRGRRALVDWLRPQQDWAVPGLATQGRIKGVQFQRGTIKAPVGNMITEFREIRWEQNGRPMRRTYSATWRNSGGLWEIAHERVSADKPVTGDRQIWP